MPGGSLKSFSWAVLSRVNCPLLWHPFAMRILQSVKVVLCQVGLLLSLVCYMCLQNCAHHPPWNPPLLFSIGYGGSPPPPQNLSSFHQPFSSFFFSSLPFLPEFFPQLRLSMSLLSYGLNFNCPETVFWSLPKSQMVTHGSCELLSCSSDPNKVWTHSPWSSTI